MLGSSHTSPYSVLKENLLAPVVLYNSPSPSSFRGRLPKSYSNFSHWEVIITSLALIYTVARTYTDSEGHCPGCSILDVTWLRHDSIVTPRGPDQRWIHEFITNRVYTSHHNFNRGVSPTIATSCQSRSTMCHSHWLTGFKYPADTRFKGLNVPAKLNRTSPRWWLGIQGPGIPESQWCLTTNNLTNSHFDWILVTCDVYIVPHPLELFTNLK